MGLNFDHGRAPARAAEAWTTNRPAGRGSPDGIGADVLDRLHFGRDVSDQVSLSAARTAQALWCSRLDVRVQTIRSGGLMPTLTILPPVLEEATDLLVARCTMPVNLAGVPALSLPVPTGGPLPASLQLVAPSNGEEQLVAAGLVVEAACAS
jgi:Asp-tRNA(Asn)/Glu-tRNA(Gln) amidotransferase A subunit family amidase